jgi:hypothetical protein
MAGMPMYSLFRPLGQFLLAGSGVVFLFLPVALVGFLTARSYKRSVEEFLAVPANPD